MRTPDHILIKALHILSTDIQSEDGVANAAIAEGALRLSELVQGITDTLMDNLHLADGDDCTLIKLKKLDINKVKSRGYSFFMETIFLINKLNIKIHETPIHFKSRFSGESKIAKIEIFRTLFNVIRLKFFR